MISRQEFNLLRRLIVMTREHFDQIIEYLDAHAPYEDLVQSAGSYLPLKTTQILSENPLCDNCGSLTMRCGTCYRCYNCGTSLGCS